MNAISLRPYQQQFIADVRNEFLHNHKRVVGVAPCGAGKTIMTGWMIKESLKRGKTSIFFVHRQELIDQTARTFDTLQIPYGIINAHNKMQLDRPVQIASVQTLVRRLENVPAPDFLICDECHHILANSYKKVLDAYKDSFLLGVTATPQRMGGISLCDAFDSMVVSLSVDELIKLGNLTPFKYFAPSINVNLHNVRTRFNEFVNEDLVKVMIKPQIIHGVIEQYKKLINGKSAICYCVNVNHSKAVTLAFHDAGITAAHVDGETDKFKREAIVEAFREGTIKVLCNAELFGEGFDVPNMQAVILARPTKSLTLFIQQALRPLRPDPNDPDKVAVILDLVQNYKRHGLPNDNHDWSLEPNPEKISDGVAPTKLCPMCNAVVHASALTCPVCEYKFPKEDVEVSIAGSVVELDTAQDKKISADQSRIKRAFTKPEEFLSIAKDRDYKIGWVAIQSLKFAQSYDDCLHIADICGYKRGWAYHKWQQLQRGDFP